MGCTSSKEEGLDGTMRHVDFCQDYDVKEQIGRGGFSEVFRCERRRSKEVYAVKIMKRTKLSERDITFLREEVRMLKLVNQHTTRVIHMHDFYEDKTDFYMVLEFLPGGDLFDRIHKKQAYTEEEARHYVQSLLLAVKECHDLKVVHRDLKPENLLVKHDDKGLQGVKLADFGFATIAETDTSLSAGCGTMHYVAPEILRNKPYGRPVDMWSCGVIAYIMLGGYPPFYGENKKALIEKIKLGAFKFHEKSWGNISPLVKDLIRRLLVVKPENRMTANEALTHEWMRIPGRTLSFVNLSETLIEFKRFNARRKFRAYVRTVMAVNRMRFILNSFGNRPPALTATELSGEGEASAIRRAMVTGNNDKKASARLLNGSNTSIASSVSSVSGTMFVGQSFDMEYELDTLISKDRVAERSFCTHRLSDKRYEVKIVNRDDLAIQDDTAFRNEVRVLKLLSRDRALRPDYVDRVAQFVAFVKQKHSYHLVMEPLLGGMLFDKIHKQDAYSEYKAREIIMAVLHAVKACHDNGIVHCNVKPETLRLASLDDETSLRLVDFDLAGIVIGKTDGNRCLSQRRGTLYYIAPEILCGLLYGKPVDLWSAGVVSYILLGGYPPFYGNTKKDVIAKIKAGDYSCDSPSWSHVSAEAKDFIANLLVTKASERFTVDQALAHPWMEMEADGLSMIDLHLSIIEFRKFNAKERFRVYVHLVIAANRLKNLTAGVKRISAI